MRFVHSFPNAGQAILRSIRAAISHYEPRLRNVRVHMLPTDDPLKLVFEISARLVNDKQRGLVRVRTEVSPQGRVEID